MLLLTSEKSPSTRYTSQTQLLVAGGGEHLYRNSLTCGLRWAHTASPLTIVFIW